MHACKCRVADWSGAHLRKHAERTRQVSRRPSSRESRPNKSIPWRSRSQSASSAAVQRAATGANLQEAKWCQE